MKKTVAGTVAGLSVLLLGGCAAATDESTIDYWLWDANQLPAYRQCAEDFNAANPDLSVRVTQLGWDDYWSKLTNGMVAENAPDVFTNHLSKYPDYLRFEQLVPLDDTNVDFSRYADGLADLWVGQDDRRYGVPKDWDTIALFYNREMLADAGISEEEMAELTWNPKDGGTLEEVIARLTIDSAGIRGDEEGFDKNDVEVYGLGLTSSGSGMGQAEWSWLTGTTGWTHTDENPWGDHYNYDDERFQSAIGWWAGLIEKGYMPRLATTVGASMPDNFGAGRTAINAHGSWMIGQYAGYDGIDLGIAPTPIGPEGRRASMFNGLADSIWVGTDDLEGSKRWVEYLGSRACQDVVGDQGVVFPAILSSAERAVAAYEERGIDVSPFTDQVADQTTFLFPITANAAQVDSIMHPAMDSVLTGDADPSSLTGANDRVNALFARTEEDASDR
ncbi:MAG: sugar transporter substrate-binding protein [Microbacterium sp.]|jgi:multiple sugar transport system substrate-binding protein|uniref:ABC transporter substrate-binding protein n=1 Tax=Microbacterium sp. TaxID=51671 RepID=UPI0026204E97|nr:sugar ABC transporter substrate-binding protein [Microbacterium sp.]MDF2558626.1 sugar transporter substrate-binding protein [Microbacterium sp.]